MYSKQIQKLNHVSNFPSLRNVKSCEIMIKLSQTFFRVRNDFDVLTNQLIGTHGYCTQVSKGGGWVLKTACAKSQHDMNYTPWRNNTLDFRFLMCFSLFLSVFLLFSFIRLSFSLLCSESVSLCESSPYLPETKIFIICHFSNFALFF